jgi:hypothetical protein
MCCLVVTSFLRLRIGVNTKPSLIAFKAEGTHWRCDRPRPPALGDERISSRLSHKHALG